MNASILNKVEAFVEISNALTKVSQIADNSINSGKPITAKDLSPYFTDDAIWIFTGTDKQSTTWKGVESIANEMWNPLHAGWQSGRHNYTNRCIEIDPKDENKANATWNFIGFFSNKGDDDKNSDKVQEQPVFINLLVYKGTFIKTFDKNGNGRWKAKFIHTAADLMGVELKDAMIKRGAILSNL